MQTTELLDHYAEQLKREDVFTDAVTGAPEDPLSIGMNDASFTWSATSTSGSLTPSRRTFTLRVPDKLEFKRGAVNLIVGPTGAGKTSMLMALLGEMHYVPSGPGSYSQLPRSGGIAYAAQESWVQNETIRVSVTCRILDDCDLIQLVCIGRTTSSLVPRLTRRDTTRSSINVVFCAI